MEMEMGMRDGRRKVTSQTGPYVPRSRMELRIDVPSIVLHDEARLPVSLLVPVVESPASTASIVGADVGLVPTPETRKMP